MNGAKLLVIGQEAIIAHEIQPTLEAFDYTLFAKVFSGLEAVQQIADLEPDLALKDWRSRVT